MEYFFIVLVSETHRRQMYYTPSLLSCVPFARAGRLCSLGKETLAITSEYSYELPLLIVGQVVHVRLICEGTFDPYFLPGVISNQIKSMNHIFPFTS